MTEPRIGGPCSKCGRPQVEHADGNCPDRDAAVAAAFANIEKAVKRKANFIGAPACFALEQACQHIREAFGHYGIYQVGSSLERADWRDVDLRYILEDAEFAKLFPEVIIHEDGSGTWENDPRWLLLTTSISLWLKQQTGLPVDFQFQPQTHANNRHKKPRNAIGIKIMKRTHE